MKKYLLVIVIVVLAALAAWFFWYKGSVTNTGGTKIDPQTAAINATLSRGVSETQPLEKIPNVNPFQSVETNPYKQGYKNPFSK